MSSLNSNPSSELESYIDFDTFNELKVVLGSELEEVITAFIADSDQRITAIERALEHSDFVSAGDLSHSLKGSALNLGASGLARHCFSLEHAVKSRSGANARAALRVLFTELQDSWLMARQFMLQKI